MDWFSKTLRVAREEGFRLLLSSALQAFVVVAIAAAYFLYGTNFPGYWKADGSFDSARAEQDAGKFIAAHTHAQTFFKLFFLALIVVFVGKIAVDVYRFAIRARQRTKLVLDIGLSNYWDDWAATSHGGPWNKVIATIRETGNRIIYIWAASGADTFALPSAPLHLVMRECDCDIRILLLHPKSEYLDDRAKSIGMNPADYRKEIRSTIRQLSDWKAQGSKIELRCYSGKPSWKLVLTAQAAWVQYFRDKKNIQTTPIYQFEPNHSKTALYHVFYQEFAQNWDLAEPWPLD